MRFVYCLNWHILIILRSWWVWWKDQLQSIAIYLKLILNVWYVIKHHFYYYITYFFRIILTFTTLVIYFFKRFKAKIFVSNVFKNIYEMDSPICVINLCFTPLNKMWLFMFPLVSCISIAIVALSSKSLLLIVKLCDSDCTTLYNALRCN